MMNKRAGDVDMRFVDDGPTLPRNAVGGGVDATEEQQSSDGGGSRAAVDEVIRRLKIQEQTVDIDGLNVNYVKVGTGNTNLLLCPNSLSKRCSSSSSLPSFS